MITMMSSSFPKVAERGIGASVMKSINQWQKQERSDSQLEAALEQATRAVIQEQERAGLDILTDGQIRWEDLVTPLARSVGGFELNGLERYFDNNVYYRRPILRHTPVRRQPAFLGQYLFARQCTQRPVKVVLPGPYTLVCLSEDGYYKKERPFLRSMAEILNEEARTLEQAGAMLIQFDEPALGFGTPPIKDIVEAINIAAGGLRAKTALVTYFGRVGGWLEDLQRCRVNIIGVDVVSDAKALGRVARLRWTQELALGCVDARNTKLESVAELHAVWRTVTRRVPADRLYVQPSCGLEFLPYEHAAAKLKRLVEAAHSFRFSAPARRLARAAG